MLAADFNNFIGAPGAGANKALVAFASSAAATNKVAGLFGIGFGDRGYGQTNETLVNVVAGSGSSLSADWTAMRNAMNDMATHQGTSQTEMPPASELSVGELIEAHSGLDLFDFANMISDIDNDRLNTDGGLSLNTVATPTGGDSTRSTTWSGTINATATATFTDEDEARAFFNTGGSLTLLITHPNGSAQDDEWATTLSTAVGTYELKAISDIRSGNAGLIGTTSGEDGYYGLTTSAVLHYNGNDIGGGAYSANDVTVTAQYTGATTNGAKGDVITFVVSIEDEHTGPVDSVSSGTKVQFGHRYAGSASVLTGIAEPTWAIVDGL